MTRSDAQPLVAKFKRHAAEACEVGEPVKSVTAILTGALAMAAVFTSVAWADREHVQGQRDADRRLSVAFATREVLKIEAATFYFQRGQLAPIHFHEAPAIGYIAKGAILYQVEGETPQLLKEGDAFYEPVGRRIVHFDNASTTQDAVFVDFNLQRQGDPFIVFEDPPSEPIDRRALPTTILDGSSVYGVDGYAYTLEAQGSEKLANAAPLLGYVIDGVVELKSRGEASQHLHAGETFYRPAGDAQVVLGNASAKSPAKVMVFSLYGP
jgi:quercetin dioxygenase-like cupin family protein